MTKTQKLVNAIEKQGMTVKEASEKLGLNASLYYGYRARTKKAKVTVHTVPQNREIGTTEPPMIRIPVKTLEKLLRGFV